MNNSGDDFTDDRLFRLAIASVHGQSDQPLDSAHLAQCEQCRDRLNRLKQMAKDEADPGFAQWYERLILRLNEVPPNQPAIPNAESDSAAFARWALRELVALLHDEDRRVRLAALRTVGALGRDAVSEEVVNCLSELMDDKDEAVRRRAETVLCQIKGDVDPVRTQILLALREFPTHLFGSLAELWARVPWPDKSPRILRNLACYALPAVIAGVLAAHYFWPAKGGAPLAAEPRLELVGVGERCWMDASATKIDPQRVQRVLARFVDQEDRQPLQTVELYSADEQSRVAGGRLISLAQLDCPGAKPFAAVLPASAPRYEVAIEALARDDATSVEGRWYAQQNFGRVELRNRPSPIWVQSPRHGEVVDSPFYIKGQAYTDGFIQVRIKPKMWNLYYLAGGVRVHAGQDFGPLPIREGGAEGYELYVLYSQKQDYLPRSNPVEGLPYDTGRVEIIGPVDLVVRPKYGPIRTLAQLKAELQLAEEIGAQFITPPGDARTPPEVTWEYRCSGRVSPQAAKRDMLYVLGVMHGRHVWFQSPPFSLDHGGFHEKLVRFGVRNETAAEVQFELWLIAVEPAVAAVVEKDQACPASALPQGCVRVAAVPVVKRTRLAQ